MKDSTMMARLILAFSVCLLVSQQVCFGSESSWVLEELRANKSSVIERIVPSLMSLDVELEAKLPGEFDFKKNTEELTKMRADLVEGTLAFSEDSWEGRALKLLVSLEDLVSACDLRGLTTFGALNLAQKRMKNVNSHTSAILYEYFSRFTAT